MRSRGSSNSTTSAWPTLQKMEERWLDEPVPALSDLTPREARDHPTARHALIDLIDSFEAMPSGGFNPDRLRSLLDL
jgi:hypothetical protein